MRDEQAFRTADCTITEHDFSTREFNAAFPCESGVTRLVQEKAHGAPVLPAVPNNTQSK